MLNNLIIAVGLLAGQEAPAQITITNEPTESAKAVYLADVAAKQRGNRSELAVLGTAHLRQGLPEGFDIQRFRPLINRLAAWAPNRIAVESLSGPQCDYLREYVFIHEDTADTYCPDPAPARAVLGVSGPEAEAKIEHLLEIPGIDRSAAERRRLAGLFLAAGDPWSAVVQWLRLDPADRTTGDGLTGELVEYLDIRLERRGENTIIAAAVAVKLGHERLYPVDDHTCCRWRGPINWETYGRELKEIWDNDWVKIRRAFSESWDKRLADDPSANVLDWYRAINAPEEARRAVAGDFGAAAGADVPENSGRKYLAYWETRNMRMAANIREVIDDGGRVLAIVGASHKPYYERYLGVASDLEIVDVQKLFD